MHWGSEGVALAAWYLRRAVPWAPVLGALAVGGLLLALAHRWDSLTGLVLPLVALLAVAAAALVYDDPSVAVSAVTPRGDRWAGVRRLGCGAVPLGAGTVLLAGAPGEVETGSWGLVVAGLGASVLLLAATASRRQLARPGSAIASGVVLLGLAPMVVGTFLDVRSPYPLPDLSTGLTACWAALATLGVLGCVALLAGHRGRPV